MSQCQYCHRHISKEHRLSLASSSRDHASSLWNPHLGQRSSPVIASTYSWISLYLFSNALCLIAAWTIAHVFASLQDRACEIIEDLEANRMVRKMKKRICLVLDCLCAHDFSDKTADLINLQHYVIKEKRLSERETVVIFYDVVRVVEALHKVRSLLFLSVLEDLVFPC